MEKRLSTKLDLIFWWLVWLLPLIGAVCTIFGANVNGSVYGQFFSTFIFQFMNSLFGQVESVVGFTFPLYLKHYASYIVAVELVHVLVDIIIFVPRICHKICDPEFFTSRWFK